MSKWAFLDFDNTLMETERHVLPSLIARFNDLYGDQIAAPLTLEIFRTHFHGQAREILCENLSRHFGIAVDYPALFADREGYVVRHYNSIPGGIAMAANILETLGSLKADGWQFCFVSNNSIDRAHAAMRVAGNRQGDALNSLFGDFMVEAGAIQKLNPDVYLRALGLTGATLADSFAVEDSPSGARAAIAAGLTTYGYTGFTDDKAHARAALLGEGCRAVFHDWADLPDLLQK